MGLLSLFSARNKRPPDVVQYDKLPSGLRVQIMHIIRDTLPAEFDQGRGWKSIAKTIACEHELIEIPGPADVYGRRDWKVDCLNYFLKVPETDKALDVVEYVFLIIEVVAQQDHWARLGRKPEDAIRELNHRFLRHGVGYAYQNAQIVRVDSQLLHAEVVVPAIQLLHHKGFNGPNEEFLSAHKHFRHGRHEEAILDAAKAFESTMKVICGAKKWAYDKNKATASTLIGIVLAKGLVPTWSEEQLRHVEKCLTGLATVRNKEAGHGAGAAPREVPDHLAAYALHLAASNIVFLVESFNAMR